jgi:hypothetical protein
MKDLVDKSMGIVTHITETSAKSKPADPLRLTKLEPHKKRKCSDSSGNSPAKILGSRSGYKEISHVIIPYLYSGCIVQDTVRLTITGGGHCVRVLCLYVELY